MASTNSPKLGPQTRSHGRGGAGNINSKPSTEVSANDLTTPTLKGQHYTTGRGGTGNMAKNNPTDPSESRAAQDVEAPMHHGKDMQGTYHWGRGGEGNMTVVGKSERQQSKERKAATSKERPVNGKERTMSGGAGGERRGSFRNAVEKGKEMLGLKKERERLREGGEGNGSNESAVE